MKLATRQYKCGVCKKTGHNARSCPNKARKGPRKRPVVDRKMTREERIAALFDLLEDKSTIDDW